MDQKVSKKYTSLCLLPLRQGEKEEKMTLDMDFYGVTILFYIQEKVPREALIYSSRAEQLTNPIWTSASKHVIHISTS